MVALDWVDLTNVASGIFISSVTGSLKVAGNPVVLRSTNLEIHADRLFFFLNC